MVDRLTGEAFCFEDRGYFGVNPSERPKKVPPVQVKIEEKEPPLLWETQLDNGFDTGNHHGPVYMNDTLFATIGARLYAFSMDGKIKWTYIPKYTYGDETPTKMPCGVNDLIVYRTIRENKVMAFDKQSGQLIWQFEPGRRIECMSVSDDNAICVKDEEKVYGIDPKSGKVIWSAEFKRRASQLIFKGGKLYACADSFVLSMDISSGNIIWETKMCYISYREAITLEGNTIYVGTSSVVMALSCETGERLWDIPFPNEEGIQYGMITRPIAKDGKIYVRIKGNRLACIDPASKTSIWQYTADLKDEQYFPDYPAVQKGYVFCDMGDYRLSAVNAADGTEFWKSLYKHFDMPFVKDNIVYFLQQKSLCALKISM
jgi:outer membrane protein assembly factor BamB